MSLLDTSGFVRTKSSRLKQKASEEFKAVTYVSHKAKPKKVRIVDETIETTQTNKNELNMKKVRYEIIKFGMSGFDTEQKEEAKIQLAIKLGAKPPKNKFKNYKQLQEEKKNQHNEEKRRQEFQQLGKNQLGKSNAKGKFFKKKKEKAGFLDKYGKTSLKEMTKLKNTK